MSYTYNHSASRARKARWAKRWDKPLSASELGLLTVLSALSIYLLIGGEAIGFSTLGFDLIVAIIYLWQKGDIHNLAPEGSGLNTDAVQLENVVESELLAGLKPSMNAQELWILCARQWEGVFVIQRLGIPHQLVADALLQTETGDTTWNAVVDLYQKLQLPDIDSGVVAAATLLSHPQLAPLLSHLKIKETDILSMLQWQQRAKRAISLSRKPNFFGGIGRDWSHGYTPLLDQFAANLSKEVELGYYRHIPTVHEQVIKQLASFIVSSRPAALVGGIGSGRTSVVYALAERIAKGEIEGLEYYQIMSLNASVLISSGGNIEEIVLALLTEAVKAKNTILFLDEANLFFNSGPGAVDLGQVLLPLLQRSNIKLICAMTDHDWQALSAKQPALTGTLQRLAVTEPHPEETTMVVQDAAIGIEFKAKTIILYDAVREAIKLAGRYLPEVSFPGKAISVLENAAHYPESDFITATSVQQAIEATTGAKVVAASEPEKSQLLQLEDQIHQRMINQTRAVKVVADALRRSRAGVANPRRPVGSFLFLGPTGVGKTELAKALAAVYYGGEQAMVRLDMSEYQQPSDISRLLSPSSSAQTGGTLASSVRKNPSTVVLLDEIEKAHPDILNLLLQVLDEGRLTDTDGRQVSFKDAIVIATSNASADEIRSRIEKGEKLEDFEAKITEQLITSHQFKPELLNRFDEIVLFRPLTTEELRQVVDLMLAEVNTTLAEQQVTVAVTPAGADWLVEQGYDPTLGARPLRRTVQRTVENVVAQALLAGTVSAGQSLTLDVADLQKSDVK